MSDSLQPHGLQHARPPCSSPSPGVCPSSCSCINDAIQLSHPLMPSSPSALNLSQHQGLFQWVLCLHQMTNILELQLQHQPFQWIFRVDLSSCSRDLQESSPAPQFEGINSSVFCLLYSLALTIVCDHWEIIALTMWTFFGKVMSLLFNRLSKFVIIFLQKRSNCLLISWLQSPSAMILEPKKRKSPFWRRE